MFYSIIPVYCVFMLNKLGRIALQNKVKIPTTTQMVYNATAKLEMDKQKQLLEQQQYRMEALISLII